MNAFENILVVVGSARSDREALVKGVGLACATHARVNVLILLHDIFGLANWQLALPSLKALHEEESGLRRRTENAIRRIVAEAAESSGGSAADISITTTDGPPRTEILECIQKSSIDLLIMSAHTENGLEQHLFSRLNEDIHRRLPCSVLFVKHEPPRLKAYVCLKHNKLQICGVGYDD